MDIVIESFLSFKNEYFDQYRIGKSYYPHGAIYGNQHCQNPYLKTEADIQVKYGGFLEHWLTEQYPNLIVHAELPVYNLPHARSDLSIHFVNDNDYWSNQQQIRDSLKIVIEIKYANVHHPLFDFKQGGIEKDIKLLQSLPEDVKKYLLLIDEAELINSNNDIVKNILKDAKTSNILVVSNNISLMNTS